MIGLYNTAYPSQQIQDVHILQEKTQWTENELKLTGVMPITFL